MCSASKENCRTKSNKCIPWCGITLLFKPTDVVGVWGEEGFFWLCSINKSLLLNPEDIFSDRYIYVTLLPCYHMPGKFVWLFIPVKIMVSSSFCSLALTLHCWTNPLSLVTSHLSSGTCQLQTCGPLAPNFQTFTPLLENVELLVPSALLLI